MRAISNFCRRLRRSTSGNAALIVAMGMPMLIGGAGLGVDVTQWYMWKRELQFAVDQAALAGAWARLDDSLKNDYATRATQEYNANLAITEAFASAPNVRLVNFGTGASNSVLVTASASKELPFSSFLTGESATVSVSSQASFEGGQSYSTCMLALDKTASGAFTLGGSVSGSVSCGFGALSTSSTAMVKNGNSNAQAGYLVSGGGVDSGYSRNGTIHANVSGLSDPFEDLDPPDSSTPRTYVCPPVSAGVTTTTADYTVRTRVTYTYAQGKNQNQATAISNYAGAKPNVDTTDGPTNQTVANGTAAGTTTTTTSATNQVGGSGNSKIYETKTTTVTSTFANVVATTSGGSDGIARPQPGTYSSISIACRTEFAPGVYVIQGAVDFGQNQVVIGDDLMFVFEDAGGIHINSKSNIDLSGITASRLLDYGVSADAAAKLAGMLIYDTESTDGLKINGGADVKMEGIMYLPNRSVVFNGNSSVAGACLMIAAGQITFTGNNDIGSFCVPSGVPAISIGGANKTVKLVA